MPKKKQNKTIFFYIGLPIYRLLFAGLLFLRLLILRLKNIKFTLLKSQVVLILLLMLITALTVNTVTVFYLSLPDPNTLDNYPNKVSTKILDRNGILLYQIFEDENRSVIELKNLQKHTTDAFLAAEDKDFYKHHGFSFSGLMRAIYRNTFNQKVEGGSTITQQLVKNTLLSNEKTFVRKIKELVLSIKVEILYPKDKIFEIYLNQVGFGGPAYGIQEASKQYFGINASDLNLAQSAYLAGITRAPSKYSPFGDNISLGLDRKKQVLEQMLKNNFISDDEYQKALKEELIFRSTKNNITAPHFVMLVKEVLVSQLGENMVNHGGLTVTTTLDSKLQNEIQKTVSLEVDKIKNLNVKNGSSLVTNPKTGEVLAMVGSKNYFDYDNNGQVNLTTSLRQPGSSIKPLNYALAFENNKKPTDTVEDKPITILYNNSQSWSPKNYDNKFHGTVTLKQALANSYNIPSVLLLKENGIQNFANFAKKMGINNWNDPKRYGLSMSLGSLEVKMTELSTAYSAFANDGVLTPLRLIKDVKQGNKTISVPVICLSESTNIDSKLYDQDPCQPRRVISTKTAKDITDILSDNIARSSAFGANSVLNIRGHKVAVKTGTSNDLKDNWTIGYNKDYLVATWVGNNDSKPMSKIASGVTGASPIWSSIFTKLLNQKLASR